MSPQQKHTISIYALIANLIVSGAALRYAQETEHRITLLEARVALVLCKEHMSDCKDLQ